MRASKPAVNQQKKWEKICHLRVCICKERNPR